MDLLPTWTEAAIEKQLKNLYYSAGDPGSYGGSERLYRRAKELGIPVTRQTIESFLSKQLAYSLHKPVRHKFERNHTYVANIDQQWQADLADMQTLASENDGYRYILTCIDLLSRYAWAIPVISKSSKDMVIAFKRLGKLARPRIPQRLQTDKGKEFFNTEVSGFLRKHHVHHFASNSDQKAAVVERFNRTLKNRIWVYFTANDTTRYIDVLGDIVDAYNHSLHRSIGMHPADVDNEAAAEKAWMKLFYLPANKQVQHRRQGGGAGALASFAIESTKRRATAEAEASRKKQLEKKRAAVAAAVIANVKAGVTPVFAPQPYEKQQGGRLRNPTAVGQVVRISKWKGEFEKGYLPNWSREDFVVRKHLAHPHSVYKIEDTSGEPIEGAFYDAELQAIPRNTLQVEQVLRNRKRGTRKEVLVKWRGWADKFNRWIPQQSLKKYSVAPRDSQQDD